MSISKQQTQKTVFFSYVLNAIEHIVVMFINLPHTVHHWYCWCGYCLYVFHVAFFFVRFHVSPPHSLVLYLIQQLFVSLHFSFARCPKPYLQVDCVSIRIICWVCHKLYTHLLCHIEQWTQLSIACCQPMLTVRVSLHLEFGVNGREICECWKYDFLLNTVRSLVLCVKSSKIYTFLAQIVQELVKRWCCWLLLCVEFLNFQREKWKLFFSCSTQFNNTVSLYLRYLNIFFCSFDSKILLFFV